jgi:hypothetical protein
VAAATRNADGTLYRLSDQQAMPKQPKKATGIGGLR